MGPRLAARRGATVSGVVQGVGFRPFVYNLARALGLTGYVTNTAAGVELAVQGPPPVIAEFFRRLESDPPPLARIAALRSGDLRPVAGEEGFTIRESQAGTRRTLISPDVCVCEACLAEMRDPADRRHGYPFINCTHCGPRYTIIRDLPYDRPQTTMAAFAMCEACRAEYEDPTDRRFHAQPVACPDCGPRVWLADCSGQEIAVGDPIAAAGDALRAGQVVAIKGLGGFHLAADAFDEAAVARLRARKHREEKPLALMVPNLAAARALADLDPVAAGALTSRERPIVLAPQRAGAGVAPSVNPGNRLLGLMLPYTPLHHLLMDQGFAALVMTSGNLSDEPICLANQEAVRRIGEGCALGPVADLFLLHDRDIYLRSDDSVVRVLGGRVRLLRRSRGYAPSPLFLTPEVVPEACPPVLAAGAHLKNTLCLLRGREAFVSQHVGDLDDARTLEFFELTASHLETILEARAQVVACDLHPDYLSSRWAAERGLPLVRVQHHHAHAVAVMAEHGLTGRALALSLDGTGLGDDATVWGGELLAAGYTGYARLGSLHTFALFGGDKAVKEPWRVGLMLLALALGPEEAAGLDLDLVGRYGRHLPLMLRAREQGLNTPVTTSLGRLFDGAAAILGLSYTVAYEGQAAITLEQAQDLAAGAGEAFDFPVRAGEDGCLVLDWRPAIAAMAAQAVAGVDPGLLAARFHQGLVAGLAAWALAGAQASGLERVCLGGGCFLNATLMEDLPPRLEAAGLTVFTPAALPAGDGGLSLGQAVAAAAAWGAGMLGDGVSEVALGPWEDEGE